MIHAEHDEDTGDLNIFIDYILVAYLDAETKRMNICFNSDAERRHLARLGVSTGESGRIITIFHS